MLLLIMTYTTSGFRIGPEFTPLAVKKIIFYTCIISFGSAITEAFFTLLFKVPGPQEWFSLSWWGISHYLLWQPLSYLFVNKLDPSGITFSYLLTLFFNLYLLWIIGSDITYRIGSKPFLRLYFISGIGAGLLTLFLMPLLGQYSALAGATPAILGLLIVWSLLHPEQEILLFFLFPIKAKWLSLAIIGIILAMNLSSLNLVNFTLYISGALIGYFYALIALGIHSPFSALHRFELATIRLFQKVKSFIPTFGKKKKKKGKIIDINKTKANSDEEFIDAILEKISKHGEHSLSWSERKRMEEISKKKSR